MRLDESAWRSRFLIAHDLFGKPLRTFPDHALALAFRSSTNTHSLSLNWSSGAWFIAKSGEALQESHRVAEFRRCFDGTPLTPLGQVGVTQVTSIRSQPRTFRRKVRFRMKWFRSNIKCMSRIALFALGIQLALSFGHFHGVPSAATSVPEFGSAASKLSLAADLAAQVDDSQSAREPASNHDSGDHPGDICAICAVMAMANAALFATPPSLPLPQIAEFSRLTIEREFARVASASVAFQPRAPPIS